MDIKIFEELPSKDLLTCKPQEIHDICPGPFLVHLKGELQQPLFITSLLHGNEHSSFYALQKFLCDITQAPLKRSLIFLIGNTQAAKNNQRHIPGEVDFNRVWCPDILVQHKWANQVIKYVEDKNIFVSLDIHNNSSKNPIYGCVNRIDKSFIQLVQEFSEEIVYFTEPREVLSMAFARFCPSLTLECGLSGDPEGIKRCYEFIKKVYTPSFRLDKPIRHDRIKIFHTIGRLKLDADVKLDFQGNLTENLDFSFIEDFDSYNFKGIDAGFCLGYAHSLDKIKLLDNFGKNKINHFFEHKGEEILTLVPLIPSMFSKDASVIYSDSLGYLMEKVSFQFD